MGVRQRSIYPDGLVRTCCYLARIFVKGDGFEAATVIVVDGVQDGTGVGEDGEGISSDVCNDALAIPVSRRDSLEASFWLAWKDRLHTIDASRSRMALLGDRDRPRRSKGKKKMRLLARARGYDTGGIW